VKVTQEKSPVERKCPYAESIKLVGNKWSLQIIKELHLNNRPMRFNEFMKALKPVSSKTLSEKLKELNKCGVIKKQIVSETPVIIHYSLTEKGKELTPVLDIMANWNRKWTTEK
jgi:DNA-binding HxlR family transcriptional regulator